MTDMLSITEAQAKFGALARRTAITRERVCITERGETLAVLISPAELLDLEEPAAAGTYLRAKRDDALEPGVPQAHAREMLFGTSDEL